MVQGRGYRCVRKSFECHHARLKPSSHNPTDSLMASSPLTVVNVEPSVTSMPVSSYTSCGKRMVSGEVGSAFRDLYQPQGYDARRAAVKSTASTSGGSSSISLYLFCKINYMSAPVYNGGGGALATGLPSTVGPHAS